MNFSILSDCNKKLQDILVIGKTIERDGRKYHIPDMTLSDEIKLYIIKPYDKQEPINRKGIHNHRWILKEYEGRSCCYLHCSEFYLGDQKLQVQGGMSGSLEYSLEDYGTIQLFLDMMNAGWTVPEWLKDTDWKLRYLMMPRLSLPAQGSAPAPRLTGRCKSQRHRIYIGRNRMHFFSLQCVLYRLRQHI
ncbi:hypothetical protein AALC16_07750 [Lachnospiraceae bacterium 29-91]